MELWLSLSLLAVGIALLSGTSGIVVSNIVAISEKRGLRKSVLSFFLVAATTSLPELVVAITAIFFGHMALSLGDILGSNIANVCLIVGVSLVVMALFHSRGKKTALREEDKREFTTALMLLSIILLMLLYLQYTSGLIGISLLGIFFGYSYVLMRKMKEDEGGSPIRETDRRIRKELILTMVGIAGVILGARLTVESAIDIATFFGIPASIIGATLVAIGTSLPELTVNIRAAYGGYPEIIIGNIVGSNFFNSTFILGLLLTFTPFKVNLLVLSSLILFSVVSQLLLWYFLDRGMMGAREGFILLSLYLVNLLSLLGILILHP